MSVCRWHKSDEVPGGKFLVPGCWNRVIYGDDADCFCPKPPKGLTSEARSLFKALAALRLDDDQIDAGINYMAKCRSQGI